MLCYQDKTFCSSKVKTHTCGRELSDHDKEKADELGLPIAYAEFCKEAQQVELVLDKELRRQLLSTLRSAEEYFDR